MEQIKKAVQALSPQLIRKPSIMDIASRCCLHKFISFVCGLPLWLVFINNSKRCGQMASEDEIV
jgi:hypothetical protein